MRTAGQKLGYMLGVHQDTHPYERPLPTTAGAFQAVVGEQGGYSAIGARFPREKKSKLAGDAFNLNLVGSTGNPPALPAPYIGGAELRNVDITIPNLGITI